MRLGLTCRLIFCIIGFVFTRPVHGFHSGGTAECSGCHTMHSGGVSGSFLLKSSDPSSTCLNCHQDSASISPNSYIISTPSGNMPSGTAPRQRTPGGDFGWLKKNYIYTINGITTVEDGSSHGHNVVAADFGFSPDPVHTVSPGGFFPSSQLGCTSCHDPHGRYRRLSDGTVSTMGAPIIGSGSYNDSPVPGAGEAVGVYRMLAGAGYAKPGATFTGVPAAVAPGTYNRTEAATQTRVAYGHSLTNGHTSWGNWCTSCHANMHPVNDQVHPIDLGIGSDVASHYASYLKTGDMNGSLASSYLSLVPFVESTGNYAVLASHARNDDTVLTGPSGSDEVSCITCHRAHAGGWRANLRWNMGSDAITYTGLWPGTDTTPNLPRYALGRTSAETQAAYYDRPTSIFADTEKILCNKCHDIK